MILAFDTETTGLPDFKRPSDEPQQPHLVQLAIVLLDDDFTERASASLIIRPDGWTIPDDIAKIHGITTEIATRVGVPEKMATDLYTALQYEEPATLAVAHNVSFDLRIMRIAMLRHGYSKDWQEARLPKSYCTMTTATPIVNLPPTDRMLAAGFTKPKPPRLTECVKHFFDEDLTGAHDALVDVRATLRLYRHLVTL
jgi:DNA polymerase-3 subunit epsilon